MHCSVNFNVLFKLIKVHFLVSELYLRDKLSKMNVGIQGQMNILYDAHSEGPMSMSKVNRSIAVLGIFD